jgi:hypothetical protein
MKSTLLFATILTCSMLYAQENVGVGTTSPLNKLHIHDDSVFMTEPPLPLIYGKAIALQVTNAVSGDSASAGLLAGVTPSGYGLISSPTILELSLTSGVSHFHMSHNLITLDSNLIVSGNLEMPSLAGPEDLNLAIGPDGKLKTAPITIADADWTEGGGFVYNTTNWVGVGTDMPTARMMISGEENTGSKSSLKIYTESSPGVGNTLLLDGDEIDVMTIGGAPDQLALQGNSIGDIAMVGGGGHVGIGGQPIAERKLHVRGKDVVPGETLVGSPAAIYVSSTGTPDEMLIDANAIETVHSALHLNGESTHNVTMVEGGGHVGVGPTSPYGRLSVEGADNNGAVGTLRLVEFGSGTEMLLDGDEIDVVTGSVLSLNANTNKPVTIGTHTPALGFALSVDGRIMAEEIQVQLKGSWPDYVFAEDYTLLSLEEVETSIAINNHLPGIPSAAEVADEGITLGDMQRRLLEKVEELTLHMIAMNKRLRLLEEENAELKAELNK